MEMHPMKKNYFILYPSLLVMIYLLFFVCIELKRIISTDHHQIL